MSDIENQSIALEFQPKTDYPLQPIVPQGFSTLEVSRSLLDDQDQSNLNPLIESNEDVSHVKGFQNTTESIQTIDLEVNGNLPDWLTSEHYTVGPGTFDIKYTRKIEVDNILQSATATFTLGHWFDALPLVNRFDINGERNTIKYRSHLTSKRLIEKIRDHHGYVPNFPAGLFKTNGNQTILIKFLNKGKELKPNRVPCGQRITTQIPGLDGRLFSQNFANHIQELDPFDLTPTQVQTWDKVNTEFQGYSSCPNGQFDAHTGEYFNFTMEIGYRSTRYHFFSISEQEPKGHKIATIWNAPTGWVNSFALTANFIIMVIHPMLANSSAVRFAWNESILDSFTFYPSEPTLFYVISRSENKVVACYRSSSCFYLNQVNAYEDVYQNVVIDIVCYEDDTIVHRFATENLRNPEMECLPPSEVRRFVLSNPYREANEVYEANNSYIPSPSGIMSRMGSAWNYVTGKSGLPENAIGSSGWYAWIPIVKYERISDCSLELPQINPNFKLKKYSFVYGLGNTGQSKLWDSIVKIDMDNNAVVGKWHEKGCYPSEAQFVPKPKGLAVREDEEDSGVLISVVLDVVRNTSFLLVLDAKNMSVIAKSDLNKSIPLSIAHGSYCLRAASP